MVLLVLLFPLFPFCFCVLSLFLHLGHSLVHHPPSSSSSSPLAHHLHNYLANYRFSPNHDEPNPLREHSRDNDRELGELERKYRMAKIDHGTVEGSSKYAEETLRMFGAKMRELEDTRAMAERSGDREWANRTRQSQRDLQERIEKVEEGLKGKYEEIDRLREPLQRAKSARNKALIRGVAEGWMVNLNRPLGMSPFENHRS